MFRKQAVHMTAPKRRHHPTKPLQSGHRPHMTKGGKVTAGSLNILVSPGPKPGHDEVDGAQRHQSAIT
jgi:hypothetical protein